METQFVNDKGDDDDDDGDDENNKLTDISTPKHFLLLCGLNESLKEHCGSNRVSSLKSTSLRPSDILIPK